MCSSIISIVTAYYYIHTYDCYYYYYLLDHQSIIIITIIIIIYYILLILLLLYYYYYNYIIIIIIIIVCRHRNQRRSDFTSLRSAIPAVWSSRGIYFAFKDVVSQYYIHARRMRAKFVPRSCATYARFQSEGHILLVDVILL